MYNGFQEEILEYICKIIGWVKVVIFIWFDFCVLKFTLGKCKIVNLCWKLWYCKLLIGSDKQDFEFYIYEVAKWKDEKIKESINYKIKILQNYKFLVKLWNCNIASFLIVEFLIIKDAWYIYITLCLKVSIKHILTL